MLHMNNFTHKRDHTRYAALMWYQRCVLISDSRWAEPTFSNAHLTFCMLLLLLQKLCLIFWSAYFLPCFIISCSRNKYHMRVVKSERQCMQCNGIAVCVSRGHQPRDVREASVWSGQRRQLFNSRQWERSRRILPLRSVSPPQISAFLM